MSVIKPNLQLPIHSSLAFKCRQVFHPISCLLIRNNHTSFEKLCFSPCDNCSCVWGSLVPVTCTNCLSERTTSLTTTHSSAASSTVQAYTEISTRRVAVIFSCQHLRSLTASPLLTACSCLMSTQESIQTFPTPMCSMASLTLMPHQKEQEQIRRKKGSVGKVYLASLPVYATLNWPWNYDSKTEINWDTKLVW